MKLYLHIRTYKARSINLLKHRELPAVSKENIWIWTSVTLILTILDNDVSVSHSEMKKQRLSCFSKDASQP